MCICLIYSNLNKELVLLQPFESSEHLVVHNVRVNNPIVVLSQQRNKAAMLR